MIETRTYAVTGRVQGRGYRPRLAQLAAKFSLAGWVKNSKADLLLSVAGKTDALNAFETEARSVFSEEVGWKSEADSTERPLSGFSILDSDIGDSNMGDLPSDIRMCEACLEELQDPHNRRFQYPFITCSNCGPRYSIGVTVPYDRTRTTMRDFEMCSTCFGEYSDKSNRRFHAETVSCWDCGPTLSLEHEEAKATKRGSVAFQETLTLLREGKIVAVKSVGGFHLLADATNPGAIQKLRAKKNRPSKPFAVLMQNLAEVEKYCQVNETERKELLSEAAPIVLLRMKEPGLLCQEVAPSLNRLGVMLPSNPLEFLLVSHFKRPLVATSCNLAGEFLSYEGLECKSRLKGIADSILDHNRRILHPVDDSIVCVIRGQRTLLRRARGYPQSIGPLRSKAGLVALGSYLKNTVAWVRQDRLYLTPHIGDLEWITNRKVQKKRLKEIQESKPEEVISDLHPDFPEVSLPLASRHTLQHHKAHVLSCMVDKRIEPPLLGIAWDGMGYGEDGSIWGGEFFSVKTEIIERIGTFFPFLLSGSDRASREPKLVLGGVLEACGIPQKHSGFYLKCSSVGRLFDAVAALTKLCELNTYEGEAAIRVQVAAESFGGKTRHYPFELNAGVLDWRPMFRQMYQEVEGDVPTPEICHAFHSTLSEMAAAVCRQTDEKKVVLTGGCFQNTLLAELTIERLERENCEVYWHHDLPPNDGGVSVGQAKAYAEGLCV